MWYNCVVVEWIFKAWYNLECHVMSVRSLLRCLVACYGVSASFGQNSFVFGLELFPLVLLLEPFACWSE
jgi:hypothetical protein